MHQRTTSNRFGATLVEFAISLPIVFMIFFGMIEVSRFFMLQHSADTAAYEGARNAIVPGAKPEDAIVAASDLLKAAGVKGGQITVEPEFITEETALVTVSTVIPLKATGWVVPNFFGEGMVKSEVTLICERPPMVMLTGIPKLRLTSLELNLKPTLMGGVGTAPGQVDAKNNANATNSPGQAKK